MTRSTVRLTMAQALVRYLCNQFTEIDGERVPLFAGVFAIFGHGNVTCLSRSARGGSGHAADLARPERAVDGAGRDRLRQGQAAPADHGRRLLDRARRHQHGDRRRPRPLESPAGAAARRRHLRQPPARPGDAAGRALRKPDDHRERRLQGRSAATGTASRCPSRSSARCRRRWRRCSTRPTAARPSCRSARTPRRSPTTTPRPSSRRRVWSIPRPRPDRDRLAEAVELLKSAKKPLIISGGGVRYSLAEETVAQFALDRGIPISETIAGKGAVTHDHPAHVGPIGILGSTSAQRAGRGGGRGAGDRHAAHGLHHRLLDRLQPRRPDRRHQRRPLGRDQAPRAGGGRRRPRDRGRARRGPRRLEGARRLDRRTRAS